VHCVQIPSDAKPETMKLSPVPLIVLTALWSTDLLFSGTQPPPGQPTPAYSVHIHGVRAVEMSPDEKYLAAFIVQRSRDAPSTAEVQVWDFRSGVRVRSHDLPASAFRSGSAEPIGHIHYTSDGALLIVCVGDRVLHVFNAADLAQVRTIEVNSRANIDAFEASPLAHHVAVRMAGNVRVYDLDSSEELRSWQIDERESFNVGALLLQHPVATGFTWRGDGKALAVAVADNSPCLRGGGTIYIYELGSEKPVSEFRVPLLPGDIAFGMANNLYVATDTCGGYFAHWTPGLPIFDSTTGKQIGKIPAGRVGVRNHVAISANKQILLAYANRQKTVFEFEDTLRTEDAQWQVRELANGRLILTLPAGGLLSSSGRFVYQHGRQQVSVFSVPATAN
jgi:WD40 repeat protein